MKDPLQPGSTPYELLTISQDASAEQIDAAFKDKLRSESLQQLQAARRSLQDPVERAVVDAFLYPRALLASPDQLLPPQRARQEAAWRQAFTARFPDAAALHCLAICWYWSARSADTTSADGQWRLAAAAWAALLANGRRWERPAAAYDQVTDRIGARLLNDLANAEQTHRDAGRAEAADRLRAVARDFESERESARQVAGAGLMLEGGPFTCGAMLIDALDLRGPVERALDRHERERPGDAGVARVRAALSGLRRIEWLLTNHDPDTALNLLEALPPRDRQSAEVASLEARAQLAIAKRHADAGQGEQALAIWERVLASHDRDAATQAQRAIVRFCRVTASGSQASRTNETVRLLERGYEATDDVEVGHDLAALLLTRSLDEIAQTLKGVDLRTAPAPAAAIGTLRVALKSLDRATQLGSPRSEDQARWVRGVLNDYEMSRRVRGEVAFNDLPAATRRRLVEALAGRGTLLPLLKTTERRYVAAAIAAGAIVALIGIAAAGYGAPGLAWQGVAFLPGYAVCLAGVAVAGTMVLEQRERARCIPFRPGQYIFPLDAVDITAERLVIRPLETAKLEEIDQYNKGKYTRTDFTFTFADGQTQVFQARPKAIADNIVTQLKEARLHEQAARRGTGLDALAGLDVFRKTP